MQSLEDYSKHLKEHFDELTKEKQHCEAELENLRKDKASISKGQKSTQISWVNKMKNSTENHWQI